MAVWLARRQMKYIALKLEFLIPDKNDKVATVLI